MILPCGLETGTDSDRDNEPRYDSCYNAHLYIHDAYTTPGDWVSSYILYLCRSYYT